MPFGFWIKQFEDDALMKAHAKYSWPALLATLLTTAPLTSVVRADETQDQALDTASAGELLVAQTQSPKKSKTVDEVVSPAADNDAKLESELADAAAKGRTATVEKLLAQGVRPNSANSKGWPAIALAAKSGYVDTVVTLLEKGATINAKHKTGYTALMLAANGGHAKTVQTLLDHKANVNATKDGDDTALSLATKHGYNGIIAMLKAAGAK
jgi:ankyrin repeat protein